MAPLTDGTREISRDWKAGIGEERKGSRATLHADGLPMVLRRTKPSCALQVVAWLRLLPVPHVETVGSVSRPATVAAEMTLPVACTLHTPVLNPDPRCESLSAALFCD